MQFVKNLWRSVKDWHANLSSAQRALVTVGLFFLAGVVLVNLLSLVF